MIKRKRKRKVLPEP